jgi:hypothetical protein
LIKSQAGKKNQGSSSSGKWSWTTIEDCVLTVPVKFTMVHIRMMIKAAEMAGFKVFPNVYA